MEITLFDRYGVPRAYIAEDEENSIYLWKGQVVAYVDGENVYGWKGRHLGWFVDGILYDIKGICIGFTHKKCPVTSHTERTKHTKHTKHTKCTQHTPYTRLSLTSTSSDQDLEEFLSSDAIGIK